MGFGVHVTTVLLEYTVILKQTMPLRTESFNSLVIDVDDTATFTTIHFKDAMTRAKIKVPMLPAACDHFYHCVDRETSNELERKAASTRELFCPVCGKNVVKSKFVVSEPMKDLMKKTSPNLDVVYVYGDCIYGTTDAIKNKHEPLIRILDTPQKKEIMYMLHKRVVYKRDITFGKPQLPLLPTETEFEELEESEEDYYEDHFGYTTSDSSDDELYSVKYPNVDITPDGNTSYNPIILEDERDSDEDVHTERVTVEKPKRMPSASIQLRSARASYKADKKNITTRIAFYEKRINDNGTYSDTYRDRLRFLNKMLSKYTRKFHISD